jgi:TonB family protein
LKKGVAILVGFLATSRLAQAQASEPYFVEDPARWGAPSRVVEPEYPSALLADGQTGYVDIEGQVGPLRNLLSYQLKPDRPENQPMAKAVEATLRFWEFYPAIGSDCMPVVLPSTVRVFFEIKGGKPVVSVTRRTTLAMRREAEHQKPLMRPDPHYPRQALREGLRAYVYSRMDVDPEGRITKVTSQVHTRPGGEVYFERAVEEAFLRWRFTPGLYRSACQEVFFRLKD